MSELVIIIPAFNESEALPAVLEDLKTANLLDAVVVVDDGSSDDTAEVAENVGVRVIRHDYNMGYGAALKTGVRNTDSEYIALFDADGQHRASDLQNVLAHKNKYDMVVGARGQGSDWSLSRFAGKKILAVTANSLCGRHIPDLNSGMRVMSRVTLAKFMNIMPNTFSFSTTSTIAFHRAGYRVGYEPITTEKRVGHSTVNVPRDGLRTLLLIIRLTTIFSPLRLFIPLSALSFLLFLISISINIANGFDLTDSTILFGLSTLLIFSFGLISDQISHIRREMGERNG